MGVCPWGLGCTGLWEMGVDEEGWLWGQWWKGFGDEVRR